MPVDEALSNRLRAALEGLPGLAETRMMGGVCFLLDGNMVATARREKSGDGHFMFRVGKEAEAEALKQPGTRPMVHAGRPFGGFVYLDEEAADDAAMRAMVSLSLAYVTTLPPKPDK